MKKQVLAATLAGVLTVGMVGSVTTVSAEEADKTYTIGICQLVQHVALDAATQGFKDAVTEALGDAVTFDEQNAQGDSNTCSTIINSFVSNNVDLILANATPALQAAAAGTNEIPILGTSVTEYGVALEIRRNCRRKYFRYFRPCSAGRSGSYAPGAFPGCKERRSSVLLR